MQTKPWSSDEITSLLDWRKQGRKTFQIAELLDRTDKCIRYKLYSLGYSSNNDLNCAGASLSGGSMLKAPTRPRAIIPSISSLLDDPSGVLGDSPTPGQNEVGSADLNPQHSKGHDTTINEDREASRRALLLEEARGSVRKYQAALRSQALEDRIASVFAERICPLDVKIRPPHVETVSNPEAESALLLLSDTHIGQHVSTTQTNGFGDYSIRRYCERLAYLEQTVIRLLRSTADRCTDELHLCLLGDILHGMLQHCAEREDTLLIADQFQLATWTLFQCICRIASVVPATHIWCVVGNHGRWANQRKMPTTNRFSNLDYLVYSALAHSVRASGAKHIHFHLNDAPRQILQIKGSLFQLSHGDHLRGGDKQLAIPIHAIAREVNASAQRHAAAGQPPVRYHVVGDKHKPVSLPLAAGSFIVNGSFVGTDEYGMGFPPVEPTQLLCWAHPRLGLTWQYPVKVGFAPPLDGIPYELPERIAYLLEERRDEGRGIALPCA